jgi:pSer/pThr/pTyr-binding forkhead associated (FHA) protein
VRLATDGTAAGTLDLIGPNLAGQITIGERELRDGVLLGRYARCDTSAIVDDPSLSRVHALLIQIDDRVLLVDTASVNGTRLPGEHRSRLLVLDGDTDFQLGKQTRARWRSA